MTTTKKYEYQVTQDQSGWTATITRRATATKTVISKTQEGFSSEAEAHTWGKQELKEFLEKLRLKAQKKHNTKQRRPK